MPHQEILGFKKKAFFVYERVLLAIMCIVQKWGKYLSHRPCIIKSHQKNTKYLLEQNFNTPFQLVCMSKLMGFDFEIQYKTGASNVAADAFFKANRCIIVATDVE